MDDARRLSYTLLFDIFKPNQIIGEASKNTNSKATEYLSVLKHKQLINYPEDSFLEPWANKVFNSSDIFAGVPSIDSPYSSNTDILSLLQNTKTTQSLGIEKKLEELHLSEAQINLDYRFSRLEVTPIDMNHTQSSDEPLKAKFLGYGVIRLYRDKGEPKSEIDLGNVEGNDTMVAILGVPFYFTASDLLLGFFDKETRESVSHFRLIRSQTPNRFMVLMKFRIPKKAKDFVDKYDGKPFNSMEPEPCNIIYIKRILFRPTKHEHNNELSSIPYLLEDPFTYSNNTTKTKMRTLSISQQKKPCDNSEYVELATCPVCLERLDSTVTGLCTIPCQHTFHCDCLSQWNDDTCPVCRYSNKFDIRKHNEEEQVEKCVECNSDSNLWICLICGNIGCGRYDLGHAIDHYNQTSHCFAMETTTQRVWDYAGDNYVHRLIQNEADGKLVELPLRTNKNSSSVSLSSEEHDAKVEKVGFEYSKMLISQLESQREYYDLRYVDLADKFQQANDNVSKLEKLVSSLTHTVDQLKSQSQNTSKLQHTKQLCKQFGKKVEEERSLNQALSDKIEFLSKENESMKKEKVELQEQVNDLMFYLESQEKFKDASDDLKEGQIIIKPSLNQGSSSSAKKKKGKRR